MECPICLTAAANFITNCNHSFCKKCITTWKNYNNNCPICRSILLNDPFLINNFTKDALLKYTTTNPLLLGYIDKGTTPELEDDEKIAINNAFGIFEFHLKNSIDCNNKKVIVLKESNIYFGVLKYISEDEFKLSNTYVLSRVRGQVYYQEPNNRIHNFGLIYS